MEEEKMILTNLKFLSFITFFSITVSILSHIYYVLTNIKNYYIIDLIFLIIFCISFVWSMFVWLFIGFEKEVVSLENNSETEDKK